MYKTYSDNEAEVCNANYSAGHRATRSVLAFQWKYKLIIAFWEREKVFQSILLQVNYPNTRKVHTDNQRDV